MQSIRSGVCMTPGPRRMQVDGSSYSRLAPMGPSRLGVLYERGLAYGDVGCAGVSCRISVAAIPAQF
jgi:hypothetical protein